MEYLKWVSKDFQKLLINALRDTTTYKSVKVGGRGIDIECYDGSKLHVKPIRVYQKTDEEVEQDKILKQLEGQIDESKS